MAKVHNLLGEPLDDDETQRMMSFFNAPSPSKRDCNKSCCCVVARFLQDPQLPLLLRDKCITFEKFMSWWNDLHNSGIESQQHGTAMLVLARHRCLRVFRMR